jgi:hypothetical protein
MRLNLELELIPEYHETTDGDVRLEGLRFSGCNQNVLIFLSAEEQAQAQAALEEAHRQEAVDKVRRLLAADNHREMVLEIQQETMRELEAQRGLRV